MFETEAQLCNDDILCLFISEPKLMWQNTNLTEYVSSKLTTDWGNH